MQVSIIIVNYNTKQLTLNCLKSIYEHTRDIEFEIILVDNASSDGSVEAVAKQFPEVKIIASNDNLGFGRANNLGAKYAKGEFLFLLNSDTLLIENTLLYLFKFMKGASNDVGACGVSLLSANDNKTVSAGNFPSVLQEISDIGFKIFYKRLYDKKLSLAFPILHSQKVVEVDYICGADVFIRKSLFEELNGFDKDYFMYFEETDLFFRLKSKGYKSVVLADRHLIHLEGGSTKRKTEKFNLRKYSMLLESKKLYYKKNKAKLSSVIMKICSSILVSIHPMFWGNRLSVYKIIWK